MRPAGHPCGGPRGRCAQRLAGRQLWALYLREERPRSPWRAGKGLSRAPQQRRPRPSSSFSTVLLSCVYCSLCHFSSCFVVSKGQVCPVRRAPGPEPPGWWARTWSRRSCRFPCEQPRLRGAQADCAGEGVREERELHPAPFYRDRVRPGVSLQGFTICGPRRVLCVPRPAAL